MRGRSRHRPVRRAREFIRRVPGKFTHSTIPRSGVMREDPEDPWEDGYLRGDPRSRRSSGGSSSSAADGGISVKTLTTYLTSSTARGLNAVAALLVVAGLIAVAQTSGASSTVGWAGSSDGSRGRIAMLDIGAGVGPSSRLSSTSTGRDDAAGAAVDDAAPSRTWTFKSKQGSGLEVPERAPRGNVTLTLKTSGERDIWGRKFYADDSPSNLLAALADATDATAGNEWSQIPAVRRQLRAFAAVCGDDMVAGGRGRPTFIKALAEYARLYEELWRDTGENSTTGTTRPRVLIVRDAFARRGRGLGDQQAHLARWLMFGMATTRAVFFQHCAEDGEPWEELYPTALNPPPPRCSNETTDDDGYFNLGDYFRLMGGIDLRWNASTAAKLRALDVAGTHANLTVVGACNDRTGHVAHGDSTNPTTTRMFTCDCCESCDSFAERGANTPGRYLDRFKKFWADEHRAHSVIAFEHRSRCGVSAIGYRDDPALSWYARDMPRILAHVANTDERSSVPPDWAEDVLDGESAAVSSGSNAPGPTPLEFRSIGVDRSRWEHCSRFAMTQPSPTVQTASMRALRKLTAMGEHRPLVGFYALTNAATGRAGTGSEGTSKGASKGASKEASDADCELPADAEPSWIAVDAAFAKRAQLAPGTSGACGFEPYDCDGTYDGPGHLRVRLPWTALYGQLSGYLDCARRAPALGLPLVSIATAGEFTSLRTESGDVDVEAPARVYAATDSALVHALLVKEGDEGAGDLVVFGNVSGVSDGAKKEDANLKAAVDFYALSLADVIVAPARSSFGDGAARRGFPFKAVLGGPRDACVLLRALAREEKPSADDAGYHAAQLRPADALRGLEACFRGMRALGLNPHVPNDAREAMDRLASSVESNPE